MKFLTDQDIYAATVRFLSNSGHDVITAYEAGLSRSDDKALLREAEKQNRILDNSSPQGKHLTGLQDKHDL